jgi:hypothetical protein
MLFLDTLVNEIGLRIEKAEPFHWVDDEPTHDDLAHIISNAEQVEFDTRNLKMMMLDEYRKGRVNLVCKTGPYAKVLALAYPTTVIPWDMLSLIFKACSCSQKPFRVVWFANPDKRLFPDRGVEPAKEHVNGGYAMPCDETSIVIYREEEFCRVLIHELLHATCTDTKSDIVSLESYTETWAELILIAILARGNKKAARKLWNKQAQWIADQEYQLQTHHNTTHPGSYAWRYTIGRRRVLQELGFLLPKPKNMLISLRFTSPDLYP